MLNTRQEKLIILLFLSLLLAGCFGGGGPATRFYLLSSIPEEGRHPAVPERAPAIGVGPVRFPDYLDRPEIAMGSNPNQLRLSEFHQWAEPLKNNFERVLGENLALLIPTDSIVSFPWDRSTRIDYQVKLDVIRFLVDEHDDDAALIARWRIVDWKEKKTLAIRKSDIRVAVEGSGYEAIAAAQSRTLARLSEEIAGAIRLAGKSKAGAP
jgi:uncharacterized protein